VGGRRIATGLGGCDPCSHCLSDAVAEDVSGPWKLLSTERHHFFVVHTQPLWPEVLWRTSRKYPEITLSVSYLGTDALEVSPAIGLGFLGHVFAGPQVPLFDVYAGDGRVRGCAGRGGGAGSPEGRGPG
jgi:hypothetical protein